MNDEDTRIKGLFMLFSRLKLFCCGMCGTSMPIVHNAYLLKDDEIKTTGMCPKCGCVQWTKGISTKNPGI